MEKKQLEISRMIKSLFEIAKTDPDTHLIILGNIGGYHSSIISSNEQIKLIKAVVECMQSDDRIREFIRVAVKCDEIIQKSKALEDEKWLNDILDFIKNN